MAIRSGRTSSIRMCSAEPAVISPSFRQRLRRLCCFSSTVINMACKEYGSYDGLGLADLVRKKEVSARESLDEAIARTAKVDPQINAVVVKNYDYAQAH